MLIDPASRDFSDPVQSRNVVRGKEGRADVSDKATHAVDCEDIEGIVDTKDKLQLRGVVGEAGP